MYATGNKKMLNMLILDMLKEYSDETHRLTQQEIIRLLKVNYDMECDRRSVKNNILCLKELGYEISTEDGYYLMEREFDNAELRMLIDSVLFSKHLTQKQAKTLIEKLSKMGNRYFRAKVNHVSNLPDLHHGNNKQLMYVLDIINEAISQKKKICFVYNSFGMDFKLHPKREKKYVVNPYQMVANNGFYYLIGNYDKYNDVSHYRLDKMTSVEMLEENVKPQELVTGKGWSLPKHMAEHVYMYGGESVTIHVIVEKNLFDELIDWFGNDFHILQEKVGGKLLIRLKCNENAFFYWALQYGQYVEVIKPVTLRNKIAETVRKMNEKYQRSEEEYK